jgi:predicted  nucleic acid-binding Zn-ribbon protein
MNTEDERVNELKKLVVTLPTINQDIMVYLLNFLIKIAAIGEYSMDASNLAICWAPTLISAEEPKEPTNEFRFKILHGMAPINTAMTTMIHRFTDIFEEPQKLSTDEPIPHAEGDEIQALAIAAEKNIVTKHNEEQAIEQRRVSDSLTETINKELTRLDSKSMSSSLSLRSSLRSSTEKSSPKRSSRSAWNPTFNQSLDQKQTEVDDSLVKKSSPFRHATMEGRTGTSPAEQNDFSRMIRYGKQYSPSNAVRPTQQDDTTIAEMEEFRHEMVLMRDNMRRDIVQLRDALSMNESITVQELKNLWVRLDTVEGFVNEHYEGITGVQNTGAMDSELIKDEVKGIREAMVHLQSHFSQLNERLAQVEYEHVDLNKRIDELLKEQRYNKIRMDYDIEHMKRLVEGHASKLRDVGLELTTMKSKMEARLLYGSNPLLNTTSVLSPSSSSPTIVYNNNITNSSRGSTPITPISDTTTALLRGYESLGFPSTSDEASSAVIQSPNSELEKKLSRRTINSFADSSVQKLSSFGPRKAVTPNTDRSVLFSSMGGPLSPNSKKWITDPSFDSSGFRKPSGSSLLDVSRSSTIKRKSPVARNSTKDDPYGLNKLENLKSKYKNDYRTVNDHV